VYGQVLDKPDISLIEQEGRTMPERNIVIVGAGASFNACPKGLPLGKDTATAMREHFSAKIGKELLDAEIKRLHQVFRLPKDDFETILYAISRFDPKGLREELHKRYNAQYHPNLTYEILAHLFKHRFIDVIINFNFDELLDQAIADELNPNEYRRIVSDGEYDQATLFNEPEGLRYPCYIKPHGTASHKSSMRFTREDYFSLPADIEEAIKKLIRQPIKPSFLGEKEEFEHELVDMPINFIIIGFNMQSLEFNLLLENHLSADFRKTRFFFFQRSIENEFFHQKEFPDRLEERLRQGARWIKVSNEHALDDCFQRLWDYTRDCFRDDHYKPRNIERHRLIAEIFNTPDKRNDIDTYNYLFDRTLLELALSIVKYKGFVSIDQLVDDRFGKYYNLLKKSHAALKRTGDFRTIPEYCHLFGLKAYSYGKSAFYLPENEHSTLDGHRLTKTSAELMDTHFERIVKILNQYFKGETTIRRFQKGEIKQLFRDTMESLAKEQDSEISPEYENIYQNIFKDPRIIKTQLAFNFYTRYYLFNRRKYAYKHLLVIAETGEWLYKLMGKEKEAPPQAERLPAQSVRLIIADESKKQSTDKEIIVENLQWWLHNQHMTILLREDEDTKKLRPILAIYFTRRQRSSHINPVILENPSDLSILIRTFESYWNKAEMDDQDKVPDEAIAKQLESYLLQ
jgi:hypothetical protein